MSLHINTEIQKGRNTEVRQEPLQNQMRWFNLTYSFYNNKGQYQEKTLQGVFLSLGDAVGEIQKSVGGREVNILSHNSGRPINFISQSVLRILIKKNLKWYEIEKKQANRQVKIDKMHAKKSAGIDRAVDGMNDADLAEKLINAKNKGKYLN